MKQILVMMIDLDEAGNVLGVSANWSDGLNEQQALGAVQLVDREIQRRVVRAEVEAEQKAAEANVG